MLERRIGICPQNEKPCSFRKDISICPDLNFEYCRDFAVIAGSANKPLVREIGVILRRNIPFVAGKFPNKETLVKLPRSVDEKNVYIIQTAQPDPDTRVMETALMIDAVKRAGAKQITVIFSCFPYARQDRKDEPRVPISASVVANFLEERGANRLLTIDLHAEQVQGFVKIPWDNLYASYILIPELQKRGIGHNRVVCSPDAGGARRANFYFNILGAEGLAIASKIRNPQKKNEPESLGIIGEVKEKDILIVDDIIDSAKTLKALAEDLKNRGAKDIAVAAPHGLFTGKALKNIEDSEISYVLTTNSMELGPEVLRNPKIEAVSLAPLISSAICRIQSARPLENLILSTKGK
jgi:ribose-phosphate pyrophosphokinase